ncbi:MAG: U32 family peptidase [Streptococcaceae bacterium]|jgi:collagenase-like PrtC family protease|nr:U32 family peptidase [Streptococcaceae bacterium]
MPEIEITATCQSLKQARQLVELDITTLYFGEAMFGLRLPHNFTRSEIGELTQIAHQAGKKVTVAVNAIMHPKQMAAIPEYLKFLEQIGVDQITVGDTGVIHVLNRDAYKLPYIYDASTMVTSARQINFWGGFGAIGGVIAREVPKLELAKMSKHLDIFGQILVYGASVIHQSKRPLLQNYYNFIKSAEANEKSANLFLAEPKKENTHYSIYEDNHGTHIFANNDLNLMPVLDELLEMNHTHWFLDGIYTPEDDFTQIVALFTQAALKLANGRCSKAQELFLAEKVRALHPKSRGLDTGFYALDPKIIQ